MLPDFPEQKRLVSGGLVEVLRRRIRGHMTPFGEVRTYRHHEGHRSRLVTSEGEESESGYHEVSSELLIEGENPQDMPLEELVGKLERIAKEMAGQAKRHAYEAISEAVERAGNVVNAQGRPLTPDTFLEVLEKMDIDFDPSGQPIMPTLVVGTELAAKLRERVPEWERDPANARRFEDLIRRKREEWRDREARRRLVD